MSNCLQWIKSAQPEVYATSKLFNKGNEARRAARNKAAKPGATRRIGDKRKKLLDKIREREGRS